MKMKNNKQRKGNVGSNISDANSQKFNESDKGTLGLTLSLNHNGNEEHTESVIHTSEFMNFSPKEREAAQKVINNNTKKKKTIANVDNHDVELEDSFRAFNEDGGENLSTLTLSERLEKEDAFIQSLIDTIPPKFYFDQETRELITAEKHAYAEEKQTGNFLSLANDAATISSLELVLMVGSCQYYSWHFTATPCPDFHLFGLVQLWMAPGLQGYVGTLTIDAFATHWNTQLMAFSPVPHPWAFAEDAFSQEWTGLHLSQRKGLTKHEWREKRKIRNKMNQLKKKDKQKKMKVKKVGSNTFSTKNLNTELLPRQKPRPIYNKEGKLVYSKFDFSESGIPERKKGEYSGKNHKKIIERVQQDKIKLQKLEGQNPEKAQELQEKTSWMKAIYKSEGVKVKDNIELLKKSMKKEEQKKKKSRKQWQTRLDDAKKIQYEKQKKRRDNIHAKKQEKIDKKIKRAKKKGRLIPGF
ncbi:uncharacterized protein LOC106474749 [Limulus polyphemus]|uniref:Uncharacterized protein LOC106474749 n=1 Tax=Limulus polyphemus TaxID=6850 RepID=A0ABM1RWM7_LIMPO|nr:uncharacterized protein LOC106474749 [Limulus polyphemus]